ncbi:MAG: amino acid permease [Micromonosporaceae bacterium]|nr:amino acid permease [Micromonosporaceae bacterium]
MGITIRLGGAVAAGVPVLVLVSMGPVAALTGTASVAVWVVSAAVGFLMALLFAELAGTYPQVNGGVAPLSARVLGGRSRFLARAGQWSYWFGWCPAPAINGLVIAGYARQLLVPDAPSWTVVLLAGAILVASVAVNRLGLRAGGRLQLLLICCVVGAVAVLFAGALLRGGGPRLGNLHPFAPPGGWTSAGGWLALAGGLFIAGWSAYAAELALTYSARYRHGVRDAVRVLVAVAGASVLAFAVVPFLLVATVGIDRVTEDPVVAFDALSRQAVGGATAAVLVLLMLALLLGLNLIAIASSWTLHQMARNGDAWARLGRLNRHGSPANALRFDLVVNLGLVGVVTAITGGDVSTVPIALLAAANVGYFVSMCLALAAAWSNHRSGPARRLITLRPGLARLAPLLIGFQVVLLAAAGHAWGWRNLLVGAAVLAGVVGLAHWRTGRSSPGPQPPPSLPACWAPVAIRPVATASAGASRTAGSAGSAGSAGGTARPGAHPGAGPGRHGQPAGTGAWEARAR